MATEVLALCSRNIINYSSCDVVVFCVEAAGATRIYINLVAAGIVPGCTFFATQLLFMQNKLTIAQSTCRTVSGTKSSSTVFCSFI
jgi:hypothetical protein